jgi:16S rRNA (cytidine1402-2'-O)-methyltransferase
VPGTLHLIATPIGNLRDITLRALDLLRRCDRIACEDTRHSRKLLAHYDIHRPLVSFHAHNWRSQTGALLAALAAGEDIALMTDAGTPGISDPGAELVAACREAGHPVVALPGPSAVTMAVLLAEVAGPFVFEGFLPAGGRERRERLAALAIEVRPTVLFEAPHRLAATLKDLVALGDPMRSITLCREMTKLHEEVWQGCLAEAVSRLQTVSPRGEYTLVLAGATPAIAAPPDEATLRARLRELLAAGLSRSEASRALARETGLGRKDLYRLSLALEETGGSTEDSVTMDEFDAG